MSDADVQAILDALKQMSPMPDDHVLEHDSELIDRYSRLIARLETAAGDQAEPGLIERLVNSFGLGDGFEVYWSTVHLIERYRSPTTYSVIQRGALSGAPGVRKWCCLLLGRRREPEDLEMLLACLVADEPQVVCEALQAIEMIGQRHQIKEAAARVQTLIGDPRPGVSNAAAEALQTLRR